ncbi:MAG: condensation domain-containing protein, partial [Synechococcales bacterium]|nr:condensation domain-containing protein [Synechococcales bacterium]
MTMTMPAVEDLYPLSPTQKGMLFHSLYGPDSGVYVVQVSFTVRGNLNLDTFSHAWQWLVQRHPVLRTAFAWDSLEEPLQVVGQQATIPLHVHDWRHQLPQNQAQDLADWLMGDRRQGFDLSAAPLMRLTILHLAPNTYRIIWTYHHLLLDGWSVPLLLRELLLAYQAFDRGQTPVLDKPRPYRDYIAWLKQQDLAAATRFWQQRLQGLSAPTPLGIGRPRPIGNSSLFEYAVQKCSLSPELTAKLRSHAQVHRLTLNTLVQGAWALVMGHYSSESDVLFGSTCAGRPPSLQGNETMVGLFINTLPMRVNLSPDQTVGTWLQDLQTQQLDQQPYEYTPLTQIHGSSDIPRSLPLFESVVVFENYPVEPTLKHGIRTFTIEDVTTAEQTNYPLALFAMAQHTLDLKVQYSCDRFTPAAIERLLGHLETVLTGFLTHTEQSISTLPLLTPAEQQQIQTWNQTEQSIPERCVHELIADQAEATPDAIAVIFEDTSLSYRELNHQTNQFASYLKQLGLQQGHRIAVCLERSTELVITFLAILKAGATYVPLDPTYPTERLRFILEDAQVSLLITANAPPVSSTLPAIESITNHAIPILNLLDETGAIAHSPTPPFPHSPTPPSTHPLTYPKDLAYLIYTSGSTGTPKGVPIRHQSLTNLLTSMAQTPGMTAQDTLLAVTTLAFDIAAL